MSIHSIKRAALLAALLLGACAPAGEPIVAPLPQGAALDTAGRPYLRTIQPEEGYVTAVRNNTRSATGAPGARYWQNRVRYSINASLDPESRRVTGTERIVYHNRSPDELRQVVFNLYQNLFTEEFTGRNSPLNTGGLTLTKFNFNGAPLGPLTQQQYEANQRENRPSTGYLTTGTISRVRLPSPIAAGDSAVFEIDWNYRVPPMNAPRTGFEDALGGRVFQVAQWYPQIAVYDDVVGLDITPYRENGEFYLEYGDFDVALTLPAGWTVGGTGELVNASEILRPEVRQRLAQAAAGNETVTVLPSAEWGTTGATTNGENGSVTWRFAARDVRDFAWATSNRYQWDARRAQVAGRTVMVNSLFRPGAPNWNEAAMFGEHSTEFISEALVPYAYPQITVSEGPIYGMEYPMIVFIGRPTARLELYQVISHEVGHEWFPMMVGQDEAAYAWMDEGFTTYNESRAVEDLFPDFDPWEQPRTAYLNIAGDKGEVPLMRHIDLVFGEPFGVSAYFKPGTLMRSLQRVLGDSVMSQAMRTYANEWMFKHPYPWDFFNTMERVSGRDLDWFFYPFWYRTVTFDQTIGSVTQTPNGIQVTVRDLGQVPAPTDILVTTASGQRVTETIPIERWLNPSTRSVTVTIPVDGPVARVELDPEVYFPDVNRRNNVWTPGGR
ncbi:M1 family metallopeptidase [Longimicrobium sp.]|uniref:M1 family metallopeptidase n=1 Tax=Longimicrobium sp. TaxID=2029185 RepID=UPI003B3AF42F